MILITGDIHGDFGELFKRVRRKELFKEKNNYIIVTGDFGLWDEKHLNKLKRISENIAATILFVDGNHENFDLLYQFPIVEKFNGKVRKIFENIYHLIRGEVYVIDNKSFFCFGGACSHDIKDGIINSDIGIERAIMIQQRIAQEGKVLTRIKGYNWWEEEMPTEEEMKKGIENLQKYDNCVDYIITHDCPRNFKSIFCSMSDESPNEITLGEYFDKIYSTIDFRKWFCGHYHQTNLIHDLQCIYRVVIEIRG